MSESNSEMRMRDTFAPVRLVPGTATGWQYTGEGVPDSIVLALAKVKCLHSEHHDPMKFRNVLTLHRASGGPLEVTPGQYVVISAEGKVVRLDGMKVEYADE